jgi:hypothetical protein
MALYAWANELGGIVTGIEHRYFGESLPYGNQSFTAQGFESLTLDNIIRDSVALIDWIKDTVPGASGSKVIVFGGKE